MKRSALAEKLRFYAFTQNFRHAQALIRLPYSFLTPRMNLSESPFPFTMQGWIRSLREDARYDTQPTLDCR